MSTATQLGTGSVEATTSVTIDRVGARYDGDRRMNSVEALREISLDIRAGEVLSLIGPSGCGKTTLLNIIAGLQAPTVGRVLIEGDELNGPRPDRIALVFQDYSLLPWRTVCANVALALEFAGVPKRERHARAMAELGKVGLTQFANAYPRQLSGGMRQRVAIARAMVVNTPIVLLDEPFGALDEQTRTVLGEELSRLLADSGKTIVLITHSLAEAAFLSDRIAVMGRRPGTIRTILDVPEPHPRTKRFMTSTLFHRTRDALFELLHAEMVAAVDDTDDVGDRR